MFLEFAKNSALTLIAILIACVGLAFVVLMAILMVGYYGSIFLAQHGKKALSFGLRKGYKLSIWFFKRFADFPMAVGLIAAVYFIRQWIMEVDPYAALSFMETWDYVAQAALLTVLFFFSFFAFLYFDFRTIFRYLYPTEEQKKTDLATFENDFKTIRPWARLLSIPLLFSLLLLVFWVALKVVKAVA
jgi:hypothetical protein